MRFIATAAGFAWALTAYPALAEDAKPNDAQIAHIAYTAGAIDIKAAQTGAPEVQKQGGARLRGEHGSRPHGGQRSGAGVGEKAQRDA